jgi:hypothetical protein
MEKVFVKSGKPANKKQFTLILQEEDLRLDVKHFAEATLKELSIDMLTIYDFNVTREDYLKASNVLYMAPTGQLKVIKASKPILK